MKTSAVFKLAKQHLWDGVGYQWDSPKEKFICVAICWKTRCSNKDQERTTKIIQRLLGRHESLEAWLLAKHRINSTTDQVKLQQTRQAWLDHLIAHYESLGD
jgi:hypothetical protein